MIQLAALTLPYLTLRILTHLLTLPYLTLPTKRMVP